MLNIFNEDFQEFLRLCHLHNVRYILVGGYSVILHGYNRTTGDLDIWVEPNIHNYNLLSKDFQDFQLPLFDMSLDSF